MQFSFDNATGLNTKSGAITTARKYLIIKQGNTSKLCWADPKIYLQSSGTQYIDSGVYGNNNTDYALSWQQTSTSGYFAVMGARTSSSSNRLSVIIGEPGNADKILWVNNYSDSSSYQATFNTTAYQRRYLQKKGTLVTLNGADKTISNATAYTTPVTLKLFVLDTNGTLSNYFTGKFYYCKLYNNNALVRHFVPVPAGMVIGNTTISAPCLFDIVSQTPYYNAGSGAFTYGKEN